MSAGDQTVRALRERVPWCAQWARPTARVGCGSSPTAPTLGLRDCHGLLLSLPVLACTHADDEKARNERARAQLLRVFWDSAVMYRGPRVERSFQLRYLHTFAVWNFHSVEGAQSLESYLRFASIRVFLRVDLSSAVLWDCAAKPARAFKAMAGRNSKFYVLKFGMSCQMRVLI